MDLIIKPTEICNFKCTFCSSTSIAPSKASRLDLNKVFSFLDRFPDTRTIIVNGGDPLMMEPEYYWKILDFLKLKRMPTILSFTSNLWDFYKNPDKWKELFKHPQVGVSTSFNFGNTRKITNTQVYTEDIFWNVSNLFLEKIGYRPSFISVITEENESSALENVRLAKAMDVECKLNYAMASGIQTRPYLLSKIYKIYLEIFKQGLNPWEFNTKQMINKIRTEATICPLNRSCDAGIRCLQPAGDYYSCGAFADDKEYAIDFDEEVLNGSFKTPLKDSHELFSMKNECFNCPMFDICNGCKKTIADYKRLDMVEEHCALMKINAPAILELRLSKLDFLNQGEVPKYPFIIEETR